MHIGIVVDAVLPVKRYGGTERVAWSLGRALSGLGHKVTFFCRAGSVSTFADTVALVPGVPIERLLPSGIDVMHFNDAVPEGFGALPYIVTINGNLPEGGEVPPMAVFVSRNHAERHGGSRYVYNGLDWDDYPAVRLDMRREWYHFLGKAAWRVKNVRGAIRIVRRVAGAELHVLGGRRLNLKMGFRFTVSPRVRFHGMVDDEEKAGVVSRSLGLVFPVLWDEPFGLCLIESLYYGAPVYGTPRGSLPEIVVPEVGYLSEDEGEIARRMAEGEGYDPVRCHEYAADLFGAGPMAKGYAALYGQVLEGVRW